MAVAIDRELVVDAPLQAAWDHFADAAAWPSWHTDLTRVEVTPAGPLGPSSIAVLHMQKGPATTFRMTEFAPPRHWRWLARALWFTLDYDHRFEAVTPTRTRIHFYMDVRGLGAGLFTALMRSPANAALDKALPKLAAEIAALPK